MNNRDAPEPEAVFMDSWDHLKMVLDGLKREASEKPEDSVAKKDDERTVQVSISRIDSIERALQDVELASAQHAFVARVKFTDRIARIIMCWVVIVVALIVLSGIKFTYSGKDVVSVELEIATPVLVGLVAGLSANIIGLFLIVARYLFPEAASPKGLAANKSSEKESK